MSGAEAGGFAGRAFGAGVLGASVREPVGAAGRPGSGRGAVQHDPRGEDRHQRAGDGAQEQAALP
ncbi:hypothetical protein SR39_21375, partial [Methylobacterium radiotolerans]